MREKQKGKTENGLREEGGEVDDGDRVFPQMQDMQLTT